MRYLSPDGLRPNPHLIYKTAHNFNWKKFSNNHSSPIIIKGINRTWTVTNAKKKSGGKSKISKIKLRKKKTEKKRKYKNYK